MADTKVSNLPAVAAPADGDEFPCNQGGTTKKETRGQIVATVAGVAAGNTAAIAAHIAVTTVPIHGSSAAAGANTLAHRNAAGDLAATDFNAVAGTAAAPSHTFTVDPNTGLYRFGANELGIATGGIHRAHWNTTGAVILNDAAASTFMTGPGVTIQQGGFDDDAIAIKSTDVAHGMTTLADTDMYARLSKAQVASGGAALDGFKDADGLAGLAVVVRGFLGEDADITKTTAGRAIVEVHGFIRDAGTPTQVGNSNADANIFGVRTRRGGADVTLLLVDEDADLHVFNDIVVAGVVDGVDIAAHVAAAVLDHPNDSVDDTKVGNRVPQFYRRQGGHANDWDVQGAVNRTPTTVRMQAGCIRCVLPPCGAGVCVNATAVAFPVAFSFTPLIFLTHHTTSEADMSLEAANIVAAGFDLHVRTLNGHPGGNYDVMWLAIGPE